MSREIHKKTFSEIFAKVLSGDKTFDVRVADFDCQSDDILVLDEVDETTKQPTGRSVRKKVGYVFKTKDVSFYSPQDVEEHGYQVMSLLGDDRPGDYKYDFFVAGPWRNQRAIKRVVQDLRAAGKSVYCFIENEYDSDGIKQSKNPTDADLAKSNTEDISDWQSNKTLRKIFDNDMHGLDNSSAFVLVFPAGLSAHMELGVAYGKGKKCYAIGEPAQAESLYFMFDKLFPDTKTLMKNLK